MVQNYAWFIGMDMCHRTKRREMMKLWGLLECQSKTRLRYGSARMNVKMVWLIILSKCGTPDRQVFSTVVQIEAYIITNVSPICTDAAKISKLKSC